MLTTEILGYIGASLTTGCFIPQVLHLLKTKDTKAISLTMYLAFTAGVAFWLAYGLMLKSTPIILSNVATLILSSIILIMKIRNGR
jgi:MtN3 and saliva related transmembrane protein